MNISKQRFADDMEFLANRAKLKKVDFLAELGSLIMIAEELEWDFLVPRDPSEEMVFWEGFIDSEASEDMELKELFYGPYKLLYALGIVNARNRQYVTVKPVLEEESE